MFYDSLEQFYQRSWLQRFPDTATGFTEWRQQVAPSGAHLWAAPSLPAPGAFRRPCVFVSYRKPDRTKALRVAWLAHLEGFDVWMDIMSAPLRLLDRFFGSRTGAPVPRVTRARAVAAMIEMGLLNSTHIAVPYTGNAKGSQWIGYEYGRVKDGQVATTRAGCWVEATNKAHQDLPEYMELGAVNHTELALENWLRDEFSQWAASNGVPTTPRSAWTAGATQPLPN